MQQSRLDEQILSFIEERGGKVPLQSIAATFRSHGRYTYHRMQILDAKGYVSRDEDEDGKIIIRLVR
ncbi:MAG: hypothetical protein PHE02_15080 [Lachnospiraceae bacterium]|jgi:DNA-binding IclR family transcriptional regulator|uniref:LexA repressor DNA-binding domain-containing protein n=1 Tax=Methanocalculus taiwanensis TaxID=106207 RepID=A0ABD4TLF9_9EURY|nr:hypothetical protein [Methanocalculus taiwanensis]MCQ1539596.1 hypothetical protein [Methanocalculus taiwanensis]MDD2973441.1 hypothetical protein [Lachnospiraceae bacterium]